MIKIFYRRQPNALTCEIFIYSKPEDITRKGDIYRFFHFGMNGTAVVTEVIEAHGVVDLSTIKPTMILPEYEARFLMQGFLALAKEEGLKPHNESFSEGKLESMGKHLEDLRKLLKLTP